MFDITNDNLVGIYGKVPEHAALPLYADPLNTGLAPENGLNDAYAKPGAPTPVLQETDSVDETYPVSQTTPLWSVHLTRICGNPVESTIHIA